MMGTIGYFLGLVGYQVTTKTVAAIASVGVLSGVAMKMDFDMRKEQSYIDKQKRKYELMQAKQKEIATNLFDQEQEKENKEILKKHEQMVVNKKKREIEGYELIEVSSDKQNYKGIKPPNKTELLLGHDYKGNPIWGDKTNYIIAGTVGSGKTSKMYGIVLNYLACKQGTLYIGDLKGVDFFMFKDKKNVVKYVDDLENVPELIKAFEAEYEARKKLLNDSGCVNIDQYNEKHDEKLRQFMLLIDEYADIADVFHDKQGKPIGTYADIVRLARKVRAFGGRIILGTQRPDHTVICGQLKNNCSIIGLMCVNVISSNIMIGCDGCERLEQREALMLDGNKLVKVFSYNITSKLLNRCVSKLK